jgi:hypothetical protein
VLILISAVAYGHEVYHAGNTARFREAGDEDVALWVVELASDALRDAGDLEVASFLHIEEGGEDAGGIEVGETAPIDGAICPHQDRRVEVPNDPIIVDAFVFSGR